MPDHTITRRKKSYGPFRDAEFTPVCSICGDLTTEPVDLHDAKIAQRRHTEQVAHGAVVTG